MKTITDIGIWIRVSTEDQAKGESPEHHEVRARTYAQMKEWNIVTVYDLSGVSGKTVIEHPEAKRMMKDIKSGKIQGLIFSKLARLARNTRELLDFADYFQEHNGALISLQESIDTSTPSGRFFYSMIASMAQWEREEIVDRVKASVHVRAHMGKSLGGQAPYGYRWENNKLLIEEKEAVVRKLMFEVFLKHHRKGTVAAALNTQGYRTRSGKHFSDNTVGRLLTDPVAKGMRRSNYTASTGEGKHWELKDQSEWVFSEAPAIVSEELWKQVNDILDKQAKSNARPAKTAVHLFTGIVHCHCGSKMYKPSNNDKYVCAKQGCRNKIGVEDLEVIFHEQLKTHVFDDNMMKNLNTEIDSKEHELVNQISVLSTESKTVGKDIAQIFDLHKSGQIPTNAFKSHHAPLYERQQSIQENLPKLEATLDFIRLERSSADHVIEDARALYSTWSTRPKDEKKRIIETICKSIVVDIDSIEINLTHVLPSSQLMADSLYNPMDSYLRST